MNLNAPLVFNGSTTVPKTESTGSNPVGWRKLTVNSSLQHCSISIIIDNKLSIAQADNINGTWWISRVNVNQLQRNKGIGSLLLNNLIKEILKLGDFKIVVCPGGYNENIEQQYNFYIKNGFVEYETKTKEFSFT